MPHIHSKSSRPATAVLVLVLASLALAACGGSSSTSTTTASTASTSASATTPTTGGKPGTPGGRFTAIRECLKKNGITLPARKPGQRPGAGGFLGGGGGFALPKGVSKAQYEAAIKKCGGFPARGRFAGGASRFDTPAAKQALAKFAACMSENGVKIPAPNTSGNGPVFNTKGIDTASAKFKAADAKCMKQLFGGLRGRPGAAGGAAPGAGPGTANG
jgi:hypothetical protein